jgi:hypothetical protein
MKYICCQPATNYYYWQALILISNMIEFNMFKDSIMLFGYNPYYSINSNILKLRDKYPNNIILLPDNREDKNYPPSLKPHLMMQYLINYHNVLKGHNIFYHDIDILFLNNIDWDKIAINDKVIGSDCNSYLSANYIKSKGDRLFHSMAKVCDISPFKILINSNNNIGAQYIFGKDVHIDIIFWENVEKYSNRLYYLMDSTKSIYCPEFPIQSWTAEMWATLWNIWNIDVETLCHKDMTFIWPHMHYESDINIFHNAGVSDNKEYFFKGDYINKFPFDDNFDYINKDTMSYYYTQYFSKVKQII